MSEYIFLYCTMPRENMQRDFVRSRTVFWVKRKSFLEKTKKTLDFLTVIHYNNLAFCKNSIYMEKSRSWSSAHDWKSCNG